MKKTLSILLALILVLTTVSFVTAASANTSVMYVKTANGKSVNVRSAPSKNAEIIGTAAYGNPRLQYLESAHYRRCVAVSIAHPLAGKDQVSLKDFADDTFLSLRDDVSTLSSTVREVCAEAGFTPRITELDDISEVISGIESGKGVALLMDNHAAAFNPLLKMVHIREFFPVSLICVWDSLNANPSIEEYLEIYKSIE